MLPGQAKLYIFDRSMSSGSLYIIPSWLHESNPTILLPRDLEVLSSLRYFVVENIRTTRRFLRAVISDFDIDQSTFIEIDKHAPSQSFDEVFKFINSGSSVGLISEAGCPGIADPGSKLLAQAHKLGVKVIPWIGPSSILLSLMASGLNGQGFTFHGYLPNKPEAELIKRLKQVENDSIKTGYSQIFIETPYRNVSLLDTLLRTLRDDTLLCMAIDLTAPEEYIHTDTIKAWRHRSIGDIKKRPAIFIINQTALG